MLAKPEKGQMVENMLINMARMGQVRGKLGEKDLVGLLEQINEKISKTTKVKVLQLQIHVICTSKYQ